MLLIIINNKITYLIAITNKFYICWYSRVINVQLCFYHVDIIFYKYSNDCYEVVSALPMDVQINIKGSLFMYKGQLITIP